MKKNKNLSSKEITIKKKKLKNLLDEKKNLEVEVENILNNLENITTKKVSDYALNKLPIESLKELYIKSESVTDSLNVHSKERKKQQDCLDKISKLNYQIEQAKIDLAIEKINTLLKKLD